MHHTVYWSTIGKEIQEACIQTGIFFHQERLKMLRPKRYKLRLILVHLMILQNSDACFQDLVLTELFLFKCINLYIEAYGIVLLSIFAFDQYNIIRQLIRLLNLGYAQNC